MAYQKELEKNIRVQEFRQDANYLLDKSEKEYIQYALKEYTSYRNVSILMKALLSCLDTPEKLDLLMTIRDLIPKSDHKEYDSIAPYKKMAHPMFHHKSSRRRQTKEVLIERVRRRPLGFSIRGGKEMGLGIFISHVEIGSAAEAAGIQIGDQISEVNGINFEWISHESAVTVIKAFDKFRIILWSMGRLPQFDSPTSEAFTWVDPQGRPVKENGIVDNDDVEQFDDHLLSSADKRKVVVRKEHGRPFGLKIRGGQEFKLGIFVVEVDPGSVCEEHGLQVGDQILTVNNTSFRNILHNEAASILKNNQLLIMTVKSVGRIPKLVPKKDRESKENIRRVDGYNSLPRTKLHKTDGSPSDFKDRLTESPKFVRRARSSSNAGDYGRSPISPLATSTPATSENSHQPLHHQTSESEISPDNPNSGPKFEYGVGTQVMLASTVFSPVSEQLLDSARKLLNEDEVAALKRKLSDYEEGGKLRNLVQFLVVILDTPAKLELLNDVRPLLKPQDIAKFDKLVSPHEAAAMNKKKRNGKEDEEDILMPISIQPSTHPPTPSTQTNIAPSPSPPPPPSSHQVITVEVEPEPEPEPLPLSPPSPPPPPPVTDVPPPSTDEAKTQPYQSVISDLKNHNGVSGLKKIETIKEDGELEVEGAFGNSAAKEVLNKAKELQRDSVLQSRESFLAWNENYPAATATNGVKEDEEAKKQEDNKEVKKLPPAPAPAPPDPDPPSGNIESPGKPILIDIQKTAFFLGLEVKKDKSGNIVISEVVEDGAAFNDGFLQPGFIIIKVDGDDLRGVPCEDADNLLNENYDSDRPTIELVVSAPQS